MASLPDDESVPPGTYYVDHDGDPDTSLRVVFTAPFEGWLPWVGTFIWEEKDGWARYAGLTIAAVDNVVVDPCSSRVVADPPIGPGVDDLADALAGLPRFVVLDLPTMRPSMDTTAST